MFGRLVAFESEVGILAVMGQLGSDSRERGNGINDNPADRLVDVRGMPAHRHSRMAGSGNRPILELQAGVVDRQSQPGVRLKQDRGEPVVPTQNPHGRVSRQFIGIGIDVKHDRHVLRWALPAFNHLAISGAGRFVGGCRQDCQQLSITEHLADRRCGFPRIQQSEQVEFRVDFQ